MEEDWALALGQYDWRGNQGSSWRDPPTPNQEGRSVRPLERERGLDKCRED